MASINQAPAALSLGGVAGSPFALTLDVTVTDNLGNPVPWSEVTAPVVEMAAATGVLSPVLLPVVASPTSGTLTVTWTAAQTAALAGFGGLSWALSATIAAVGPLALVAGPAVFQGPTTSGASASTTADLSVQVGTATASLAATLAALLADEMDGGSAASTYLVSQALNGGSA